VETSQLWIAALHEQQLLSLQVPCLAGEQRRGSTWKWVSLS
jgi:hypothetical protein